MGTLKNKIEKPIKFYGDRENQKYYFKWMLEKTHPYIRRILFLLALDSVLSVVGVVSAIINKLIIDYATEKIRS